MNCEFELRAGGAHIRGSELPRTYVSQAGHDGKKATQAIAHSIEVHKQPPLSYRALITCAAELLSTAAVNDGNEFDACIHVLRE